MYLQGLADVPHVALQERRLRPIEKVVPNICAEEEKAIGEWLRVLEVCVFGHLVFQQQLCASTCRCVVACGPHVLESVSANVS
jgi:hypothetical protein